MKGSDMEINVLGPPTVRHGDVPSELGPRLRRLLAALIVAGGEVVSVDRLVDIVWDGRPPDGAETSLKSYVTRLRRALQPSRDDLIRFRQPGYQLLVDDSELDSSLFERDLDEARRLARLAESQQSLVLIERALSRWYGDAYAGLAEEEWVRPEAVRLEDRRLEARQLQVEALLAMGETEQAIAECHRLIEIDPLSERPRDLLMRCLHAAGRQADAMRVVPEFRATLRDEVGLEPSPALV
ncbi:MAG: AfsR/SARP family transcriptional regulator, partial [Acidimicrobiales bacterium]